MLLSLVYVTKVTNMGILHERIQPFLLEAPRWPAVVLQY